MLKYKKKDVSFRIDVFELSQGNNMHFINLKFCDGNYGSYIEMLKEINRDYFDHIRIKDKL